MNRAAQQAVSPSVLASDGQTLLPYIWTPGVFLKHYTYDGVGRLVKTLSPYPDADHAGTARRSEQFYYDGVRRIQEVVTDPVVSLGDSMAATDPGLAAAKDQAQAGSAQPLDEDGTPVVFEGAQLAPGGGGGITQSNIYLDREYVWGPGDRGVDELLVQYDRQRNAWWPVTDEGGDIVALCDRGGAGNQGRVVAQYTYDAYGQVLTAAHLTGMTAGSYLRCGHKGLFVDRLDVGVVSTSYQDNPRLVPMAPQLYQDRNRAYDPQLGRFLQPDPKETGFALLDDAVRHGRGAGALELAFDLQAHYGDGMNSYEYLGSNPWQQADPMGLSWDPFEMVDEVNVDYAGNVSALLEKLGAEIAAKAKIAATIASYLPFPAVSIVGDLTLYAMGEKSAGDVATGIAIGLFPFGKLTGVIGKIPGISKIVGLAGGIGKSLLTTAAEYASKFGSWAKGAAKWVACEVLQLGCFEAGTPVWTERGLVPIEQVQSDDRLLAQDADTGEFCYRGVVRAFVRSMVPIVALTLSTSNGATETLSTTAEHPFWVEGGGWVGAGHLEPGQAVQSTAGGATVLAVQYVGRTSTVYNLEVEDAHSYFVGLSGTLVHNTCGFEWHHFIPKEFWEQYFLKWGWVRQELDSLGKLVPQDLHKRVHGKDFGLIGAWNDRWQQWLAQFGPNSRPPRNQVFQFMNGLIQEFGLNY